MYERPQQGGRQFSPVGGLECAVWSDAKQLLRCVAVYVLCLCFSFACLKCCCPQLGKGGLVVLTGSALGHRPPYFGYLQIVKRGRPIDQETARCGAACLLLVACCMVTRDTASRSFRGLLLTSFYNIPRTGSLHRVASTGVARAGDQGVPEIQRHAQVHGVQLSARGAERVAAPR